jgi:hypothetical protein
MMKTIWKYPLAVESQVILTMPIDARILTVQMQNGVPTLWAEVDPDSKSKESRYVEVIGTGFDFEPGTYIGTVQDGLFVWHFYEVTP